MKIIMLGAPGAGKGTQAEIIAQKLGIPTISTGNILRAAVKAGTPVGLQAKAFMDAGELVPDPVIIGILAEALRDSACAGGYILDGVPRTIPQAEAMEEQGVDIDVALELDVPDETIVQRMSGRRVCPACGATYHITNNPPRTEGVCDKCGHPLIVRADDAPETVLDRLSTYHKQTEPLIAFYRERGKLKTVPNQPTIEGNTVEIMKALGI